MWSALLFALLALADPVRSAAAQEPGALVVTDVRDSADRPIAEAIATLDGHAGPRVRTNPDGRAAFVNVAPGHYRLRVIRAGYRPVVRQLDVGVRDTVVLVVMHPTVARLEEVQVIASRPTGVFGKVGRASDWAPIAGASVAVFGERTMHTDSTGSFEAPELRSGAYLLRVEHEGFIAQLRSVSVPESGAVEVAFLLDSGRSAPIHPPLLADLAQRQRWRGFDSAVVPRSELMRYDGATLSGAIRGSPSFVRKGLLIDNNACVFVNGVPKPGWTLDAFAAEQIEAIEVYAGRSEMSGTLRKSWPHGMPCGATPPPTASLSTAGQRAARARSGQVSMVVIWLRGG